MKWYANKNMMENVKKNMSHNEGKRDVVLKPEIVKMDEKLEEMEKELIKNEVVQETKEEIIAKPVLETSVIESKTSLNGNVECEGNITIKGKVNGDVVASGEVVLCGKVSGNIASNSLHAYESLCMGEIECKGNVVLDTKESIIEGNITAENCTINGKVKGNITVRNTCIIGSNAIVIGDIKAAVVDIKAGASIKGTIDTVQQ